MVTPRRRRMLLTGAAGRLGTSLCLRHSDTYDIVAVQHVSPLRVPTQDQELVDPRRPDRPLVPNRNPVYAVTADLDDDADVHRVVEVALARLGGVDVLVNAVAHSVWGPLLGGRRVLDSAERQFRFNVRLPLLLATELADAQWRYETADNRAHRRHVLNVSSLAGNRVFTGTGQSMYGATKAALNHLTRHMADEFEPIGIRVNAIAPTSFPARVSTEWVADSLVELDQGAATGGVLVLDGSRQEVISARA